MPDSLVGDGMTAMGMARLDDAASAFDFFWDGYVAAEEACSDVLPFGDDSLGYADLSTP